MLAKVFDDHSVLTGHPRWTQFAQALGCEPLSQINTSLDILALDDACEEAAGKCVTCAGSIHDLFLANRVHWVRLGITLALDGNDGRIGALGDDGNTLTLFVLLGQVGQMLGNGGNVVSVELVRVSVRHSLRLVSDHIIPVWCGLVERLLEELRDERRRERQDKRLLNNGDHTGQHVNIPEAHRRL